VRNEEGRHYSLLGGVRAFLSHPLVFFALTRRSLDFRLLPNSVHLGYPRVACREPRDQPCTRPDADVQEGEEEYDGGHLHQPVANSISTDTNFSRHMTAPMPVSPFTDIMINRLPTAPTNSTTTRLSIAQPAVNHLSATQPPTTRRHILLHLLPPPLLPQPVRVALPQTKYGRV
jgi:hypothetical protein